MVSVFVIGRLRGIRMLIFYERQVLARLLSFLCEKQMRHTRTIEDPKILSLIFDDDDDDGGCKEYCVLCG